MKAQKFFPHKVFIDGEERLDILDVKNVFLADSAHDLEPRNLEVTFLGGYVITICASRVLIEATR